MAEKINNMTPWSEDNMKEYQWLDDYLLEQQGTERQFQPTWQANKYTLSGKMYGYIGYDDRNGRPIVTLKLEPAFSDILRSNYEDIVPGYYMNKLHWSSIYLDGEVPQDVIADIVYASYKLVLSSLSKKAQRELAGE